MYFIFRLLLKLVDFIRLLMYFIFEKEGLDGLIDDFFAFRSYFFGNVLLKFFQKLVDHEKSQSRKCVGLILQERL